MIKSKTTYYFRFIKKCGNLPALCLKLLGYRIVPELYGLYPTHLVVLLFTVHLSLPITEHHSSQGDKLRRRWGERIILERFIQRVKRRKEWREIEESSLNK